MVGHWGKGRGVNVENINFSYTNGNCILFFISGLFVLHIFR